MMKKLPRSARIYVTVVVALGGGLLAMIGALPSLQQLPVFICLVLAAVVASMFKLVLPTMKNRATMSVAFVVDFAALLLLGPHVAIAISAIGGLTQSTVRVVKRNPPYRILFNVGALVVTMQTAGFVYGVLGGSTWRLVWPHDTVPLVAATLSYFLVNSGTIAIAVALSTYQRIRRVWHHNFLWGAPSYFVGACVAAAIAEIVSHGWWAILPLVGIPMYVTYRAYSVYARRLEDEHRHREVIESLNEGMIVVRRTGEIALWNDAIERITGVPRERVIGKSLVEAVPALLATRLPESVQAAFDNERANSIEHFALECNGRRRILQIRMFPFVAGTTVFLNDITERAEAEEALKRSEERYALAAAGANDGMWDWDLTHAEIYFSPRWKTMVGLPPGDSSARPEDWFERVHPEDIAGIQAALRAHIAGQTGHLEHEHRVRHEDGTYRSMLCRGVAVRKDNGHVSRIAGSLTDITERAVVQEQLRHAALHDTLTGLPNRALFVELLSQELERSKRRVDRSFAVLFLDLDRFKVVNDSLGHSMGDELLKNVTRRLESCLRDGDVIARLGGDEFTILLNDLKDPSQANTVANRFQEVLRWPFALNGHEMFVSASIGIALSRPGYTRPEDMLRDADTAMYRAKALGKARHELFDSSMHALAVDRLSLENDLRWAMERGEFALHYQPIVSLPTQSWTGFEALLRWKRDGQYMPPAEFIPLAEETGMIEPIGRWVLEEACRQAATWRAQFPEGPSLGITVNVSARQFTLPTFLETVRHAVQAVNLCPCDLRLEITETTLMDNAEQAARVLRELRAVGIKVYLDDFGTGFSSLSYLHRFPVDTLKIDRSFVASLSGHKSQPAIVQSIVALANSLGTHVIAEGVETEEQMEELIRLGCSQAQGYLFSKPLAAAAAEEVLARRVVPPTFTPEPLNSLRPTSVLLH
jgi:diguanylate cyclase (GGDEF)-like protein/PAS domain S-box-containing protein